MGILHKHIWIFCWSSLLCASRVVSASSSGTLWFHSNSKHRKFWGIPSLFPIFLLILFETVLLCGAVRIEGEFLSLFSLSTEQLGFNLCKKTLVNTFFQKLRWLSLPKLLSQERCSASDFIVEYNCYLHELILLV